MADQRGRRHGAGRQRLHRVRLAVHGAHQGAFQRLRQVLDLRHDRDEGRGDRRHRAGRREQGDRDRRERQHRAGGHFHRRFHRWQARGQGARHRPAFRPLHAERATVGQTHRRRLRDQRRFRGVLERRQRHRQPGRLPDRQQRQRGQGHADPGQGVGAGRVRRSRGRGQAMDQPAGRRSEDVPRGRPGGRGRQRQHPRAPAQPAGILFHHR